MVVYRYNNGKEVKNYSDEYTYSAATGRWTLNTRIVDLTQQYVFAGGVWKFDPSMTITLEAVKGNAESAAFYQAIVDYVGKTFGSDYYRRAIRMPNFITELLLIRITLVFILILGGKVIRPELPRISIFRMKS